MRRGVVVFLAAGILVGAGAWLLRLQVSRTLSEQAQPYFGSPLTGLSAAERRRFEAGLAAFSRVWTVAQGLGPTFNAASCADCHVSPLPGGTGVSPQHFVTLFGRVTDHRFDPLKAWGGPLLQRNGIAFLGSDGIGEHVPAAANCVSERKPPPLFGLGLVEAIPQEEIVARADPDDRDGDGISGRPNWIAGHLGRFGWKGAVPTLREFVARALHLEIGLTTARFPTEEPVGGTPVPVLEARAHRRIDVAPDPEVDDATLEAIVDYVRLLDAPPQHARDAPAHAGEVLFTQIGCAACHVPALRTGPHPVRALDRKPVPLYSDLLLHDLGQELDDCIQEGEARANEFRTVPLWGVRSTGPPYLHDGRARTLRDAIIWHGGEAAAARARFLRLSPAQQEQLLRFVQSL